LNDAAVGECTVVAAEDDAEAGDWTVVVYFPIVVVNQTVDVVGNGTVRVVVKCTRVENNMRVLDGAGVAKNAPGIIVNASQVVTDPNFIVDSAVVVDGTVVADDVGVGEWAIVVDCTTGVVFNETGIAGYTIRV